MTLPSRRRFLAAGAGAATIPLLRHLERSALGATAARPPLRFVALCNPHGTVFDAYRPRSPSALATPGSGTETDFTFQFDKSILAPFEPLKKKVLVLDGLAYRCQYESAGPKHHRGYPPFLTGWGTPDVGDGFSKVTGPSIDQVLARSFGSSTRFRSVQLATSTADSLHYRISYDGASQPLPVISNPLAAYNRLFGNLVLNADANDRALVDSIRRNKSVLDHVQNDLSRLRGRLVGAERAKLDQHLQSVRDVERQFTAPVLDTCVKPKAPAILCGTTACAPTGDLDDESPEINKVEDSIKDVTLDLMAQSLACDLTRFMTLQFASPGGGAPMPYYSPLLAADQLVARNLHATVHTYGDAKAIEQTRLIHAYYAEKVARFCLALDAIPEGDGTVLDHTVVLWGNEHGFAGDHRFLDIPLVLIGGGNGAFRSGRYLRYGRGDYSAGNGEPTPSQYSDLTAHNLLLVSILNAFGLSEQSFGWPGVSGPLPGLV